ncbi:NfeD family protein [Sanyastnella coralliicola]|uniref:NfeD family protein n=1 Tax=Sanyastnella coralliicola TaxID=3069118 RepID=UPI0027B9923A|nr:NfeD family protein [Longitalea sp. SCSIO 12813]
MNIDFDIWHYWLAACLLLFVIEVFVPGFILGCLAIGALGGMVASAVTDSIEIQLFSASIVAALAFFFLRPFALKRLFRKNELLTNVDSLIGRRAKVSQAFDTGLLKGRVAVDGDDWMAVTKEASDLKVGDIVEILEVQSNTLIVKPI